MEPGTFDAATFTVIGTVVAVGLSLAGLMLRTSALMERRMDRMDQRMDRVDQRMDRFDDAMATFRAEMQRIAERQSYVEGRIEERGTAGPGQ